MDRHTYPGPVGILQQLIRFDTTNPPGNERACVEYVAGLMQTAGLETQIVAKSPDRPNLLVRYAGRGAAPPLLFYGHADVVTTAHQDWTHPPFAGELIDGYVWGRGALDMNGGLAMMIGAVLQARRQGFTPAGDVLLAVLADEEAGGTYGARNLVEEHADILTDVRHAIGEFGGFPLRVAGRTFYLIQVGEKQPCWMEATIRGPGGHGARPMRGGTMAVLAQTLRRLDRRCLPVHITPVVRRMIESMAASLPPLKGFVLRRLLNPRWTDLILSRLGETGRNLEALFRNIVNATGVQGGEKPNVIPSEITLGLDGRILPGFSQEDLLNELSLVLGQDLDVAVRLYDPSLNTPDFELVELLGGLLREAEADAIPVPYLLPGSSDARFFSKLGIQTYGFTPMNLPSDYNFFETIHAADERIPASAVEFGTSILVRLIEEYGQAGSG